MTTDEDKTWARMAKALAKKHGLAPLSVEQAEEELASLPDIHLTSSEIDAIVDRVTSDRDVVREVPASPLPQEFTPGIEDEIADDVLQLNRNEGDADPETDALLDELRRKALEGEDDNGESDTPGMDGDAEPPGKGH